MKYYKWTKLNGKFFIMKCLRETENEYYIFGEIVYGSHRTYKSGTTATLPRHLLTPITEEELMLEML